MTKKDENIHAPVILSSYTKATDSESGFVRSTYDRNIWNVGKRGFACTGDLDSGPAHPNLSVQFSGLDALTPIETDWRTLQGYE